MIVPGDLRARRVLKPAAAKLARADPLRCFALALDRRAQSFERQQSPKRVDDMPIDAIIAGSVIEAAVRATTRHYILYPRIRRRQPEEIAAENRARLLLQQRILMELISIGEI